MVCWPGHFHNAGFFTIGMHACVAYLLHKKVEKRKKKREDRS